MNPNVIAFFLLIAGIVLFFLYKIRNLQLDTNSELTPGTVKFNVWKFLGNDWFDIIAALVVAAVYAFTGKDLDGNVIDFSNVGKLIALGFMIPPTAIIILENFIGLVNKTKKNLRETRKL